MKKMFILALVSAFNSFGFGSEIYIPNKIRYVLGSDNIFGAGKIARSIEDFGIDSPLETMELMDFKSAMVNTGTLKIRYTFTYPLENELPCHLWVSFDLDGDREVSRVYASKDCDPNQ